MTSGSEIGLGLRLRSSRDFTKIDSFWPSPLGSTGNSVYHLLEHFLNFDWLIYLQITACKYRSGANIPWKQFTERAYFENDDSSAWIKFFFVQCWVDVTRFAKLSESRELSYWSDAKDAEHAGLFWGYLQKKACIDRSRVSDIDCKLLDLRLCIERFTSKQGSRRETITQRLTGERWNNYWARLYENIVIYQWLADQLFASAFDKDE